MAKRNLFNELKQGLEEVREQKKTIDYYNTHNDELIKRYDQADMSSLYEVFDKYINADMKALELGFGSGRDMRYLLDKGIDVYGVDASTSFVEHVQQNIPTIKKKVFHSVLPQISLPEDIEQTFDVIYSIAVLMHLDRDEIEQAMINTKNLLEDNGVFIFSVPVQRGDIDIDQKDESGRHFTMLSKDEWISYIYSNGFVLIEDKTTEDSLDRKDIMWLTGIFKKG